MPSPRLPLITSLAATVAAALLLAGCRTSAGHATASDLRLARSDVPVPAQVPPGVTLRVADQQDSLESLLAASGQDSGFPYRVKYANFLGGPPMLQAFEADSLDVGFVADTPLIFAQAARLPITALAAWAPAAGTDALVTAPGKTIHGWADLKGKTVAYQQGTVEEGMVLEGLHSVGLGLKDITPVNLTSTSVTPALEHGSVAAGVLVQPLTSAYLARNPTAHQVLVGHDITERVSFLMGTTAVLRDPGKVAAVNDFIRRLKLAYQWVNTHRAAWARALYVRQYKIREPLGEKVLAEQGNDAFLPLPGALVEPQQALADLYSDAGEIPRRVDVSEELNPTFDPTTVGTGSQT